MTPQKKEQLQNKGKFSNRNIRHHWINIGNILKCICRVDRLKLLASWCQQPDSEHLSFV